MTGSKFTRRSVLGVGAAVAATAGLPGWVFAQGAPKKGGTLRITNGSEPPNYDVHQSATSLTHYVCAPCYSLLMQADPNNPGKLLPDLAESVDVSSDGKTVTFKLRRNVLFHDDTPLTAADVIYSLNRIRNPPKGIISPRKALLVNIKALEAPDDNTVVARLERTQPDFLFMVSNPFNVIIPKKVAEPLDATGQGMKRQIVGTGPFKLARAVEGQVYELARFDKYFGPPANIDKLQFYPIAGEIERAAAIRAKQVDGCFNFFTEAALASLRNVPDVTIVERPVTTFVNLIPNLEQKPFDDIRVREALSLAIDRSAFTKTVGPLSGAKFTSMGLMQPGSPYSLTEAEVKQFGGFDTLPGLGGNIEANRKRARDLLKQAGVPEGFKLSIPTRNDSVPFRDAAINIAGQLKTIGLDAAVNIMDAGAFYTAETTGNFQAVVHSSAIAGETPDQILGEAYTSYGGRNYGRWKDESIDAFYAKQSAEADPQKRIEIIRQMQLAFLKNYYQILIGCGGVAAVYTSALKGWKGLSNQYSNMQMGSVWLDR